MLPLRLGSHPTGLPPPYSRSTGREYAAAASPGAAPRLASSYVSGGSRRRSLSSSCAPQPSIKLTHAPGHLVSTPSGPLLRDSYVGASAKIENLTRKLLQASSGPFHPSFETESSESSGCGARIDTRGTASHIPTPAAPEPDDVMDRESLTAPPSSSIERRLQQLESGQKAMMDAIRNSYRDREATPRQVESGGHEGISDEVDRRLCVLEKDFTSLSREVGGLSTVVTLMHETLEKSRVQLSQVQANLGNENTALMGRLNEFMKMSLPEIWGEIRTLRADMEDLARGAGGGFNGVERGCENSSGSRDPYLKSSGSTGGTTMAGTETADLWRLLDDTVYRLRGLNSRTAMTDGGR